MASTWTSSRGRFAVLAASAMVGGAALLGGCPGTLEGGKDAYLTSGSGGGGGGSGGSDESGGGGSGDGGGAPLDCGDVGALLSTTCGKGGCHSTADHAAQLDLQTQGFGKALVGKASTANCMAAPLVDPANAEASVLYTKLVSPPECGSPMPLGGQPFDDTQLACVKTWIEGLGAEN